MPTTDKRALKVFLCYAHADRTKVRELYRSLRRRGIQPWLDVEDLIPGEDWQAAISKALASSDAFIVCLTRNSVDKEGYVQKEIKFALDKALEIPEGRIYLIPVKFEECEVPDSLSRYQWVDLFEQNGFFRLMKSLKIRAGQLARSDVQVPKTGESSLNIGSTPENNISVKVEGNIQGSTIILGDKNIVQPASNEEKKKDQEIELKKLESQAIQSELKGDLWNARKAWYEIKRIDPLYPRVDIKIRELEKELRPRPVETSLPSSSKPTRRLNTSVIVALIGLAGTIIAALLGIASPLLVRTLPPNTSTPTPTVTSPQLFFEERFLNGKFTNPWKTDNNAFSITDTGLQSNGTHHDQSDRYLTSYNVEVSMPVQDYLEFSYRGLLKSVGSPQTGRGIQLTLGSNSTDKNYVLNIQRGYTNGFPTNKQSLSLAVGNIETVTDLIVTNFEPNYDQFYDIRAIRSGGSWSLYVDGSLIGSAADPGGPNQIDRIAIYTVGSVTINDITVRIIPK